MRKSINGTVNREKYKARTLKVLAVKRKGRYFGTKENPNPADSFFLGKDGKKYEIIFPQGSFTSYQVAMGWEVSPKTPGEGIPGFLAGKIPTSKENLLNAIQGDLHVLGRKTYEVLSVEELPEELPEAEKGTCWVEVCFEPDQGLDSFHIIRKDFESSRWLHKLPWNRYTSTVMDVLEFGDISDVLMKRDSEFKKTMENVPKEAFLNYAKLMGVTLVGPTKSTWRKKDNTSFRVYNPVTEKIVEYVPKWALSIDC